jgi:hypothetical protein
LLVVVSKWQKFSQIAPTGPIEANTIDPYAVVRRIDSESENGDEQRRESYLKKTVGLQNGSSETGKRCASQRVRVHRQAKRNCSNDQARWHTVEAGAMPLE